MSHAAPCEVTYEVVSHSGSELVDSFFEAIKEVRDATFEARPFGGENLPTETFEVHVIGVHTSPQMHFTVIDRNDNLLIITIPVVFADDPPHFTLLTT